LLILTTITPDFSTLVSIQDPLSGIILNQNPKSFWL